MTSSFCINLDIDNKPSKNYEKNLDMSLKKLDWQNIKPSFKSIAIRNRKTWYYYSIAMP